MEERDEPLETNTIDPPEQGEEANAAPPARAPLHARARIAGVEAAVAAGLVLPGDGDSESPVVADRHEQPDPRMLTAETAAADDGHELGSGYGEDVEGVPAWPTSPALPDWRDPPTREVPRVLLDHPLADLGPAFPGPVWREEESDWDDDDVTFARIVEEGTSVAEHGLGIDEPDPFGFDFEIGSARSPESAADRKDVAEDDVLTTTEGAAPAPPQDELELSAAVADKPARRAGRRVHRVRASFVSRVRQEKGTGPSSAAPIAPTVPAHVPPQPAPAPAPPQPASSKRNPVIATATGLGIGFAVLGIFLAGPPAVLALVTVVLVAAAAECYQALRRARYRPAVLVGLLGVAAVTIAGYLRGPPAVLIAGAAFVIVALCWYLFGVTRRSPTANFGATVMAWVWIGLMGSFASLLMDPRAFPHRHGIAYLLGAIVATTAYDVGGYAFGSWIGKRPLAPSISPNKTLEGLVGGCFAAIAVSVAVVGHMHPWTFSHALELGIVVALFAPLGDLAESMIKRDLGVKDMGALLPEHGGMLDRIDGLLFVLPATYCLVQLFHG